MRTRNPAPHPPPPAAALYIPTSAARLLTFKFMLDFARLPALGDLLRAFMRVALNGDRSEWDRAVQVGGRRRGAGACFAKGPAGSPGLPQPVMPPGP
jgi:hypothetical protein